MNHYRLLLISLCAGAIVALAQCSAGASTPIAAPTPAAKPSQAAMLPRAVIYTTNGDYAHNVAITLNPSRTAIVSYPAPSDIVPASEPLAIGDGWWLDRRGGIGPNTAFLHITYSQYRALPCAPSPAELLADTIAGARVTCTQTLPITLSQAESAPASLSQYIPSAVLQSPTDK